MSEMSVVPEDSLPSNAKKAKVKIQIMVDNAIKSLNEKSGSSLVAIKKFLAGTYTMDVDKSSRSIKKYIKESVDSGKLIQTKGTGLNGSFKLSAAAMKPPKKVKKIKSKVSEPKIKNAREGEGPKRPRFRKDETKKPVVSAAKDKSDSKKMPEAKKDGPQKQTANEKMKTVEKVEPAKKKAPLKKQDAPAKAPKTKNTATQIKIGVPLKKKNGKENIAPAKKKTQTKKEEPVAAVSMADNGDSEDSFTESPTLQIKKTMSSDDSDEDQQGSEKDDNVEPGAKSTEDLNLSEESASSKESPEKAKVKPKGKAGAKSVKKRKSIATLVNTAKPKVTKR